jgi:hypothetical protein|tara:strand:+ start:356 stop:457 length:102 start_codon:yes stop_codon:yes gene_type:complete
MIERLCMTEEQMTDTCDASDGFLQKLPDARVLS